VNVPAIAPPGEWDAVRLVELHLRIDNLGDKLSSPFFPSYVTCGWLRRNLKRLAALHGINPNLIGNHSLRAGGATELFRSDLPTWAIQKYGRWTSDAVLLYQRDEFDIFRRVQCGFKQANKYRAEASGSKRRVG